MRRNPKSFGNIFVGCNDICVRNGSGYNNLFMKKDWQKRRRKCKAEQKNNNGKAQKQLLGGLTQDEKNTRRPS